MNRSTGGKYDFYGFGDSFPSSWGFVRERSLPSCFFGGRDPFDYPIFTHPLRNIMGPSLFKGSIFGPHRDTFEDPSNFEFLEHQPLRQHRISVPIIQDITYDDGGSCENSEQHEQDPEKIIRSSEELNVHYPLEKSGDANAKEHRQYQNELGMASGWQPQKNKYTFHSSTVTFGGINGAYYTSTTTRKMGADGMMMEESKEADTISRRATHRLSRGIHDKGHSFSRKLNSDGRIDTMQTLHNLNEDELPGFEKAWKGNAGEALMRWDPDMGMLEHKNMRVSRNHGGQSSRIIDIEVLPSTAEQIEVSRKAGSEARHSF